ncbi:MAG: ABC transporter substrate-binding protein [Thermoplasmata archaeon]
MNSMRIAVLLCANVVLLSFMASALGADESEEEPLADLILNVGAQDDMKTRNILGATDVWTSNVLGPVYGGVGQENPDTEEPIPYLLKGVDADGSGAFDLDEYGVYTKEAGTNPLEVTAYYDFNGVYSHDGVQMTLDDLLFSYHLRALDPLTTTLDVIKDKNNLPGTNYTTMRWLSVWPVSDIWDPAIPVGSNDTLTLALHFSQQATYSGFVRHTLNDAMIIPRHVWEGTGKVCLNALAGTCLTWQENIHTDFGYAYDPISHNGIPVVNPNAFKFSQAEQWLPGDNEIIGAGSFEFEIWNPGVSASLVRYENYGADSLDCERAGTPPVCQGSFFKYMHKPYIEGMLFKIYKTAQAAVFALQAGEIDVVSWSVPPEFVGGLQADPDIGLQTTLERGFFYLGYNMRTSPFGYPANDPTQGDDGLYLRKAVSHVVDKGTIVTTLLQNFGIVGDQPIHPSDTWWYNSSVTRYAFNLSAAMQILDDHYTMGGFMLGYGPSGYRNLPNRGDSQIDIICTQANYDPIEATTCNMIATNMRNVGINANAKLLAFGEIVDRLENRNMEMWILSWRIGMNPPEFYHDFFYSVNAPAGLNYPGFQNETFDSLVLEARAELDPTRQAELIKESSALLTDALPYDVLYFRDNIEAYRQDRYVNWTAGRAGSIFGDSFWSWIGIHPPSLLSVNILFPFGNTVNETETLLFEVYVTDDLGTPVDGATVTISCDPAGPTISPESGVTANGSIGMISFVAPEVGSDEVFTITVTASHLGNLAEDTDYVLVLNVDLEAPEIPDVAAEPDPQLIGGAVNISATVYDEALDLITCQILDPTMNELENLTMGYDAASGRFYRNRTYNAAGTFLFTIWAYDTSSNANSSSGSFVITSPPPTISDVQWKRLSASIPTSVNITARIEAIGGMDSAWVRVWDPDGTETGNFSMLWDGTTGRYWRVILAETVGEFQFRISANDSFDSWVSYVGVFSISDDIPPVADAGPDQTVDQGDVVQLDGSGSRDNWMVENYTWTFFNGTDVVTLYGDQAESRFSAGGVFIIVLSVRDPAGNDDTDYLFVETVAADRDGDGLSDWDEESVYGTDPSEADTDGDGMSDGAEIALGRDPLTAEREEKPFAEEYWWAFLLLAIVFLTALIMMILVGLMKRGPVEAEEELEESE